MKLVVGLGNPGERYAETRHNIGFMVAARLAAAAGIALKRQGYQGLYGVGRLVGEEAAVLLPQTFMNRSGASVASACQSFGVRPGDLIVVHDEIDLPFGVLRIKVGGGHGGHNGLRSIVESLAHADFVRVRVGVGRPPAGGDVSGHVLSRFSSVERQTLPGLLDQSVTAVETILTRGSAAAMNEFNGRDNAA
ncbi:MAG: aminoacyl-tRNA hydrolase [Deltaproteobacteria bacterium]|nr:MAG: aminoacyl-tRNA hydrolase [Deltaproteobacteria bacterium]